MDEDSLPLNDPHDRFFKEAFSRPEYAVPTLQEALPDSLRAQIDWDKMHLMDKEFLDHVLSKRSGDLLFEAPWLESSLLVHILFEHQSKVDRLEPLRLLGYMVRIWEGWVNRHPKARKLPLIIPVVFFQGAGKWTAAREMRKLVDVPVGAGEDWHFFVPSFGYGLLEAQKIKKNPRFASMKARLLITLLADIFTTKDDKRLEQAFQTLNELIAAGATDEAFIRALITYLFHVSPSVDKETFRKHTLALKSPTIQQNAMTIAEQLHQEGLNEGLSKGRVEGLNEGLIQQSQRSILDFLSARFRRVPEGLEEAIISITDPAKLQQLTRAAATCTSIEHFADSL